jgi:hypothetical protein
MALASVGWFLHVTLSDTGGNHSVLRYDLTATDATTAATDAATILAALGDITDAAVIGYALGEKFEDDAVEYGLGEVENIALISARIDSAEQKHAIIRVPAPVVGIFKAATGPDYNVVDAADTDLITYLNVFATGNEALLSDGEALDSPGTAGNVTGKRIHRKSRKG